LLVSAEKAELLEERYEPGVSVSLVAHRYDISASQLFNWRKLEVVTGVFMKDCCDREIIA
jgi:transposase-like protein